MITVENTISTKGLLSNGRDVQNELWQETKRMLMEELLREMEKTLTILDLSPKVEAIVNQIRELSQKEKTALSREIQMVL